MSNIRILGVESESSNLVTPGQTTKIYISTVNCLKQGNYIYISNNSLSNEISLSGYFLIKNINIIKTCYPLIEILNIDTKEILITNCSYIVPTGPIGDKGPTGFQGSDGSFNSNLLNILDPNQSYFINNETNVTNIINNTLPSQGDKWLARIRALNQTSLGTSIACSNNFIYASCNLQSNSLSNQTLIYNGPNGINVSLTGTFEGNNGIITKFTETGNAIWITRVSTSNPLIAGAIINKIFVSEDAVYGIGTFNSNQQLYVYSAPLGSGVPSIITPGSSNGGNDTFIVKFDLNGNALWTSRIVGENNTEAYDISVTSEGVYAFAKTIGTGTNQVDIFSSPNGSPPATLSTIYSFSYNLITVKFDLNGNSIWLTRMNASVTSKGYCISAVSNGIYLTGFSSTFIAYNTPNGQTSSPLNIGNLTGTNFAFVTKYNLSGICQWSAKIDGITPSIENGLSIYADLNNIYVCGNSNSSQLGVFDSPSGNSPPTITGPITTNTTKGFLVNFNTNGQAQWLARVESGSDTSLNGIYSTEEAVYVTGYVNGSIIQVFNGPSSDNPFVLNGSSSSDYDSIVLKFDILGRVKWLSRVAGGSNDKGVEICASSDKSSIYIIGTTNANTISVYDTLNGSPPVSFTGPGNTEVETYILKLNSNSSLTTIELDANISENCPFNKTITYNTSTNAGVNIRLLNPTLASIGIINEISTNLDGANIQLAYTPTLSSPPTDWFVTFNNGFILSK